jgi:hypothetical protein
VVGSATHTRLLTILFCAVCQVSCHSEASFLRHRESRRHREEIRRPVPTSSASRGGGGLLQSTASSGLRDDDHPLDRSPRTTAVDSLAIIFATWWGSFGTETVHALFLLRRHPRVTGRRSLSERLRSAETVEDHAALLLSIPTLVIDMANRARAILACTDLPESDPTLRLEPTQRLRLQRERLHHALLTTVLADKPRVLLAAVHAALHNGTARALITDSTFQLGYFASAFASLVWSSSALPESPFHLAWHMDSPRTFQLAAAGGARAIRTWRRPVTPFATVDFFICVARGARGRSPAEA